MPELADVEGFRRVLARHAVGHRIDRVDVIDPGAVRGDSAAHIRQALARRTLERPRRHGKWLLAPVRTRRTRHRPRDPTLVFHFGMTGSLHWGSLNEPRHHHDRVVLVFSNRELRYRDMRKLHGVRLVPDDEALSRLLDELGPDAAELSAADLRQRLEGRRGRLKTTLMDQSVVAGLGNLMVDEILWRARLSPRRRVSDLSTDDQRRLHRAMRTVLRHSMKQGRVPPDRGWLTGRRNERDGSCPRCGASLRMDRIGGRGTAWCPRCQEK